MFKRFAAVFAAVIIAATVMTVTAFAAGSCELRQTSSAPAGETFTVDVVINDNPGIVTLSCNISYNYEDVEFVSVSDTGILKDFYYTNVGTAVQLVWSGDGTETEENGVYATLTFKCLKENAAESTLSNSVFAYGSGMLPVAIKSDTIILYFGANNPNVNPTPSDPNQQDPAVSLQDGGETLPEDTEVIPDETQPPETTPEPVTTEPTTAETKPTTRRTRSSRTEPPETTPEPTTAPPTTTPEPTTTTPTTPLEPITTPPTTTDIVTTTEPITTTEPAFSDVYAEEIDNKAANRGTILIAMIAIALTAVCVVGIEYYKKNR